MQLDYYLDFLSHYALNEEERLELTNTGNELISKYASSLERIIKYYFKKGFSYKKVKRMLAKLVSANDCDLYRLNFVFLVCATKTTKEEYQKAGLSEELFYNTFEDFFYKARECKTVYGVYGIFVSDWYKSFFKLELFKLGRMQYQVFPYYFHKKYVFNGLKMKAGKKTLSVHIPSSGEPFDREARLESYKQAYEFFKDMQVDGLLGFMCNSWLLYKKNYEFMPKGSNLYDFLNDWEILGSIADVKYSDCWRVFGKKYDGKPEKLAERTSLQRAIKGWLLSGKSMGTGFAVSVFDGERIVNK